MVCYNQREDDFRKYIIAKEALRTALSLYDELHPNQKRQLLEEMIKETGQEELWRRLQLPYSSGDC